MKAYTFCEGRAMVLNAFKGGIFPLQQVGGMGLKRLTSKQMVQRIPIALVQVKAGNTSENLLNEIRFIYSLYWGKEITKNVYNNIMNSIQI